MGRAAGIRLARRVRVRGCDWGRGWARWDGSKGVLMRAKSYLAVIDASTPMGGMQ
jgi:hypothetical protein